MYLVRNGVPWDVAESWSDDERLAAAIVAGEFDGSSWDWDRMRWDKSRRG